MALKFCANAKRYIIDEAIIKMFSGTLGDAGTASMKIYTGAQPSDADQATSGSQIGEIIEISWSSAGTTGTASLTGTFTGTASADATAGWARMETLTDSDGTFTLDGDVGTGATCVFVINNPVFTSGGAISLLTAPISLS